MTIRKRMVKMFQSLADGKGEERLRLLPKEEERRMLLSNYQGVFLLLTAALGTMCLSAFLVEVLAQRVKNYAWGGSCTSSVE